MSIAIFSKTYHQDSNDILIAKSVARAFCFVDVATDLDKVGARLCWKRNKERQNQKYSEAQR